MITDSALTPARMLSCRAVEISLTSPAPRNRAEKGLGRPLLLLTLAGLAVRVAFLLLEPRVDLAGDEPSWTTLAIRALAKARHPFSPWNSAIIFYPPAYPYFVGLGYALLGSLEAVKWLQAVVGSLLVTAVGRVGRLGFSPRAGLLAAGVTAFYPDLVWYSVHFWSETLFLVLAWWAFERLLASEASGRRASAAAAGGLWGLAILTRETALLFVPVIALWLGWEARRARARSRGAVFLLTAVLTVAPWTYRNWVVFGAFVPVSTFGPHSLWQGNSPLPREEVYRLSDSVPGAIAQYRLAWEMGWRAVRERQPAWIFEKLGSEMPLFWEAQSHALLHLEKGAYGPVRPWAMAVARCVFLVPYLAVLALGIPGLAAFPLDRGRALLLLFLAYYNALHVVTFASDRFRLPVTPVLFLAAAQAWIAWREGTLRPGPRQRALAWALALAAALVVLPGVLAGLRP